MIHADLTKISPTVARCEIAHSFGMVDLVTSLFALFLIYHFVCDTNALNYPGITRDYGSLRVNSPYQRLTRDLLSDYNRQAFPACNSSDVIQVRMNINLYQIIGLDEPNQIITLNVWYKVFWFDCWLRWNPEEYENVTQILLGSNSLWSPDITWYQKVSQMSQSGMKAGDHDPLVRVWSNGSVMLSTQFMMRSFCRISVRNFPFDSQSCNLTFASWLHDTSSLDLWYDKPNGGMGVYQPNDEWEVTGFPVFRDEAIYCCEHKSSFAELTYILKIRRRPLYYKFHIIFPGILLIFISLLVFVLPVECGEKISMAITVLLSLTVFLLLVSEMTPSTSETVPLLGQYFAIIILFVSMSVGATAIVINVDARGNNKQQKMPRWMQRFFLEICGPYLGVSLPPLHRLKMNIDATAVQTELENLVSVNEHATTANYDNFSNHVTESTTIRAPLARFDSYPETDASVRENGGIQFVPNHNNSQQQHLLPSSRYHRCTKACNEWYLFSVLLDRFFLTLFTTTSIIFCLVITYHEHTADDSRALL